MGEHLPGGPPVPLGGLRAAGAGPRGRVPFGHMGEDPTERPGADKTDDRAATERPTVHVRRRLTVSEAAAELGISAEAVRSRVKRGTLRSVKESGTVYVLLSAPVVGDRMRPGHDQTTTGHDQTSDRSPAEPDRSDDRTALIESLQDQVSYLRDQLDAERSANRENRRLLAAALERIPQLETSRDEPRAPESASEGAERVEDRTDVAEAQEGVERRSWWRRLFWA